MKEVECHCKNCGHGLAQRVHESKEEREAERRKGVGVARVRCPECGSLKVVCK